MSRFDEEPDGDPHGECEAEIKSLKYQLTNYRIAQAITDLRAQLAVQPCGHPASMFLKSAETGLPLYCEFCNTRDERNDALAVEAEQAARITRLEADNAAYKAAAPLCAEHKPNGGTRGSCLVCAGIKLSAAIDRIDYACGEPNEMEVSGYTIHCNEDVVVENVKKLIADNAKARELLVDFRNNYEFGDAVDKKIDAVLAKQGDAP